MNRSWKNPSNNTSTGFVYFNTNKVNSSPSIENSVETPDFLSFGSDSSSGEASQGDQFSPSNYSSPRHGYYGKSPRYRGGGRNQYYSPIKQTGGQFWRRNNGLTGPPERNFSNKNHYHQHNRVVHQQINKHNKSFQYNAPNQSFDQSAFYDPTCLQNPWAELEKKMAEDRKKENDSLIELDSSQSTSRSVNADVREASSDESESDSSGSEEKEESYS